MWLLVIAILDLLAALGYIFYFHQYGWATYSVIVGCLCAWQWYKKPVDKTNKEG